MGTFDTARLHLRPMNDGDERIYCQLYTNAEIMRNIATPMTMEAARRSFRLACLQQAPKPRRWIIHDKPGQAPIGLLGLTPDEDTAEIGVMLLPGCEGQGFATEAMRGMVDRIFHARALTRLIARQAIADNRPVLRLMTKLGFRSLPPDKPWSQLNWELCHDEWCAAGAGQMASETTHD